MILLIFYENLLSSANPTVVPKSTIYNYCTIFQSKTYLQQCFCKLCMWKGIDFLLFDFFLFTIFFWRKCDVVRVCMWPEGGVCVCVCVPKRELKTFSNSCNQFVSVCSIYLPIFYLDGTRTHIYNSSCWQNASRHFT